MYLTLQRFLAIESGYTTKSWKNENSITYSLERPGIELRETRLTRTTFCLLIYFWKPKNLCREPVEH